MKFCYADPPYLGCGETIMQRLKDATNPLMEVSERELHRTRVAAENHFRDAAKMVESK